MAGRAIRRACVKPARFATRWACRQWHADPEQEVARTLIEATMAASQDEHAPVALLLTHAADRESVLLKTGRLRLPLLPSRELAAEIWQRFYRYGDAEREARAALEQAPNRWRAWLTLARASAALGHPDAARKPTDRWPPCARMPTPTMRRAARRTGSGGGLSMSSTFDQRTGAAPQSDATRSIVVRRIGGDRPEPAGAARAVAYDRVAVEAPLQVVVNDEPFAVIMRTPGDDEALAAGFLHAEGCIARAEDVVRMTTSKDAAGRDGIAVTLAPTAAARRGTNAGGSTSTPPAACAGGCGWSRSTSIGRRSPRCGRGRRRS